MGFRLISHEVNAAVMFKPHFHSCKTFSKQVQCKCGGNVQNLFFHYCTTNRWEGRTMDSILSSKLFSWGTTCGHSLTKRNCDSSSFSFGFKGQCGHDMTNSWKVRKGAISLPTNSICLKERAGKHAYFLCQSVGWNIKATNWTYSNIKKREASETPCCQTLENVTICTAFKLLMLIKHSAMLSWAGGDVLMAF